MAPELCIEISPKRPLYFVYTKMTSRRQRVNTHMAVAYLVCNKNLCTRQQHNKEHGGCGKTEDKIVVKVKNRQVGDSWIARRPCL